MSSEMEKEFGIARESNEPLTFNLDDFLVVAEGLNNQESQEVQIGGEQPVKSQEQRIEDLSLSLMECYKEIQKLKVEQQPFKEHIKDIKKNYIENGFLDKEVIKLVEKTTKMLAKTGGDHELDHMSVLKEIILPVVEKTGRIE